MVRCRSIEHTRSNSWLDANDTKKIDTEQFLKIVAKSGIVDPKALDRLVVKVREKLDGRLPSDPRKLSALFEKKKLITSWHAEKLLAGKYKGFFLGKHKLLGHIGTGGMSSVYLAEHVRMGDKRAIKVMPKSRVADATYLARFQLEAKAIASLSHPNIVQAYDIDNEGDVHYIVMEYVDGLDLQQLVKRDGALDFSTAADIIGQAARGLQHAHNKGVIHRDVKPANLLVDPDGVVKLLDMGLALVSSGDEESLTVVNNENVLGTADYLAPEQALNSHTVDHRADIYGLGCTLYFLLTGKPPFCDGTLAQRIAKHQSEMPPPIRLQRPDCPGELDGVCVKMIQKDPKYRYQNAGDIAEVLERFAAAVPRGAKISVGLGQSADLADDSSSISFEDLQRLSGSSGDTVSNKNSETLAESRSRILREGSGSDSGRLIDVQLRSDSFGGSFLDLQLESGYRPNSQVGKKNDQADTSKSGRPDVGGPSGSVSGKSSVSLDRHASQSNSSNLARRRSTDNKQSLGMNRWVIGAMVTVLFVVAAAIGFLLARVTS